MEYFKELVLKAEKNNHIKSNFYDSYNVKRGLRNKNGTGVLVGLTEVGQVVGYTMDGDTKIPCEGELFYRGINIKDIVKGFMNDERKGFEETAYLLLFGELPTSSELEQFGDLLDKYRALPSDFTENMILKMPCKNIMNLIQRSILVLYSEDENADDTSTENVLMQSIKLIARMPTIVSYGYQAKAHYFNNESLYLHKPKFGIGTAENILHMIRKDCEYTNVEAEALDLALAIHADHGGGDNSSFTTHVVSSTDTDTYSTLSAAVGALKGPKHGGANIMVCEMVDDIKKNLTDFQDKVKLKKYLEKILNKEAFDKKGLIYGMGHAVYTISDPRTGILKDKAKELASEKNALGDFTLYENIEKLTIELFKERKGNNAEICANVDLYSGLVYKLLEISPELYTPIFAVSRIAGWSAHRIEQILSDPKIIRPAYKCIIPEREYTKLSER